MNKVFAVAAVVLLAGCAATQNAAEETADAAGDAAQSVANAAESAVPGADATATLMDAQGQTVGTAKFEQHTEGVKVDVEVKGLPAGPHGVHIHEVGTCTAPEFSSAGGHFNPAGKEHGLENPQGPHAGDLPNMTVEADGEGDLEYVDPNVTLGAGANSLFDADGSAIVVHAGPDDNRSNPSGNSGGRIACGVITRS